jgi:hypothetical protein
MPVEAELRRRDTNGELVDWVVNPDGTEPVADSDARAKLQAIIDRLNALTVGGTVALDASTLAALENVVVMGAVDVANHPVAYPLPAAQVTDLKTVTVENPTETGLAKEQTLSQVLGQLDDATTDTVLSVLKALLAEVELKTEPSMTQQVAGTVGVSNMIPAVETGIAKDATLTDGAQKTQVTNFPATQPVSGPLTDAQLRASAVPISLVERIYDAATALTAVATGATYVTVVSFTPTTDIRIEGYNADFQAIVTAAYRMRLITGTDASPTVWHGEEVNTTANSWSPFKKDVPANTRIAIQVIHDQLTTQQIRATLDYSRTA